ncbi:MAG: QueT transporter family protein [Treponema sp.]|nr:QueT transporter family protein [Treponema sp.]
MKEVFTMWKSTKMIVLTALTAAIYAAILIPFKAIPLVPGFTEVRPGNMIPVAFGLFFGPAGAWGAAIGNTLGDLFGSTLGVGSLFGFVGNFLFAYVPYKLWMNLGVLNSNEIESNQGNTKKVILFMICSILASAACGLFIAWGVDLLGFVPFSILGTIIPINNAIAACVLGFILTILLFPRIKKWNLFWMDIMPEADIQKSGPLSRIGAYTMVASLIICLPVALFFAYQIGGTQAPVVMAVAGIGSIGCLIGGALMKNTRYSISFDFSATGSEDNSIWITGLRICTWIVFIAIIITSIVIGVMIGDSVGILIVLAGFIIAFLTVAGFMVFLGMAKDIADIRKALCLSKK